MQNFNGNFEASTALQTNFWDLKSSSHNSPALRVSSTGQIVTYGELQARRDLVGLQFSSGRGLCELQAEPSVNFIATYLAALKYGCPVVLEPPSDQGNGVSRNLPCLYRFEKSIGEVVSDQRHTGHLIHPELRLLLSTSGSTGARKFVRLSANNLASNSISIAKYLNLGPGDCAPTSLPLNYSYGLSILHSYLAVGASILLIDTPILSNAFWESFEKNNCTSFAGVPQSFRLLERSGQLFRKRSLLRYVTQAGGKFDAAEVQRWCSAGDRYGWSFFAMYGQTEASPRIAYLPPHLAADNPDSIGVAIPGGKLWVSGANGKKLNTLKVGELVYEGPNVMMGYATSIDDLRKASGPKQLKTGDMGYFDENGLFYFTGRSARFLKLSGKRVSLDEVEDWLRNEGVDCIAAGCDDALELLHTGDEGVASTVANWLSVPSGFIKEVRVAALPINQHGKPDMKAAKVLLEASNRDYLKGHQKKIKRSTNLDRVTSIFRRQFPGSLVTEKTTFQHLGGTSNDFVDLEMALEEAGIEPFENWHLLDLSELAGKLPQRAVKRSLLSPDHGAARALCCLFVILLHTVGLKTEGGGLNLGNASNWHTINAVLAPLRMPLFALLSGYAFHAMGAVNRGPQQYVSTLLNRLLAPTLFAMVIFTLASEFMDTKFSFNSPVQFLKLLYLPYAHFWFVMALCLMMSGTYIVRRYLSEMADLILIPLAFFLLIIPYNFTPNVWAINQALSLMPFFTCGYYYAKHAGWLHARMDFVVALAFIAASMSVLFEFDSIPLQLISNFFMSISLITICATFAHHLRLLSWIAPYTFFIFLWHILGTSGTRRILVAMGFENIPLMIFAGVIAGVIFPIILYHVLGRVPGSIFLRGK